MTLHETLEMIAPLDEDAKREAKARWDSIAKPLNSLGLLEEAIISIAGISGSADVDISKRAVVVMCADNGVVAEGVTQSEQEVTAIVTENMSKGVTSVCRMSAIAGVDVVPVDIGVYRPVEGAKILQRNIRRSTRNMTREPAMTPEECVAAIEVGIAVATELKAKGYGLLATGEMGIGNTTSSSAITTVLLGCNPEEVTGRGAGLSTEGLVRKIAAIKRAIDVNAPDPGDPIDVLGKVGGLDIAGLVGVYLGGAANRIPVLIDGFISGVAALVASRICPQAKDYFLASHVSNEPAGEMLLKALGLNPVIRARMSLGEGTGAVAVIPLYDMALAIYRDMVTFTETNIESYQPLS